MVPAARARGARRAGAMARRGGADAADARAAWRESPAEGQGWGGTTTRHSGGREGVYSRDTSRGNSREGGGESPAEGQGSGAIGGGSAPLDAKKRRREWRDLRPLREFLAGARGFDPPPPPLVLSGHAASLTPYQSDTPRPSAGSTGSSVPAARSRSVAPRLRPSTGRRTCPLSTGGRTRRVRLVRGEGRDVSSQYGGRGSAGAGEGGGGGESGRGARWGVGREGGVDVLQLLLPPPRAAQHLAPSLARSLAPSRTLSLALSLARSLARSLSRSLARSLSLSLALSLARSLARSLTLSPSRSLSHTCGGGARAAHSRARRGGWAAAAGAPGTTARARP